MQSSAIRPISGRKSWANRNKLLKADFPKTYAGTADLYVMFIEQGLRLLRSKGHFVYIIPNKWLRSGYGENLRKWLKTLAVEQIADFGDLPVFDEATTYPSILSIQNAPATKTINSVSIDTLTYPDGLAAYIDGAVFEITTDTLQDEGWQLTNAGVQQLMVKLRAAGKPLGEYVNGKIYYGIKTGLNEAFVIDTATKDRLIAEDPRSAEVIKPFLAGRDVKRYQTPKVDKYLILLEKGVTNRKRKGEDADTWLKTTYPPVYEWLKSFEDKARVRADKGDYWWELRACDYYNEFEKPLIMYQEICTYQSFGWSSGGLFCNNKIFILPETDAFLLALLNAKVIWFFLNQVASKLQGGALAMQSPYVKTIPIPKIDAKNKEQIKGLATKILAAKAADPAADTSALEAEIDRMVYALYGLTEAEIAIVEGR